MTREDSYHGDITNQTSSKDFAFINSFSTITTKKKTHTDLLKNSGHEGCSRSAKPLHGRKRDW